MGRKVTLFPLSTKYGIYSARDIKQKQVFNVTSSRFLSYCDASTIPQESIATSHPENIPRELL